MTEDDTVRAVMTAKYDEGKATIRELIRRSGSEEMTHYAMNLARGMNSQDVDEGLKCSLAIVGLFGAWLELLEESTST